MYECGNELYFAISENKDRRLYSANFCRDRMCPSCQQRRSKVIFHQVHGVCESIGEAHPTYKYLLLTLTVPNVPIEKLSSKMAQMGAAWLKLSRRIRFKKSVKGWFRTMEITYNSKAKTYHPHYHILLCVPSSYFTKGYIPHGEWLSLWQDVMNDESITQVDVRKIKANVNRENSTDISSACAEVGKYATKPSDYLDKVDTVDMFVANKTVVCELAKVIKGKKLIAYGGLMLKHFKLLDLKDAESKDVDLVNIADQEDEFKGAYKQAFYWNIGLTNYIS